MKFRRERQFNRDFAKLPQQIQRRARKQLALFLANPRHASVRAKKMKGHTNLYEGRVTKDYRFIYRMENDTCVLLNIGKHEIVDRR